MNEYDCMRNYIDIIEEGSLSKASQKRRVPISILSKQLNWLEDRFKTRLIERTTRRFSVTEAGYLCYERAKVLVDYISETKQSLLDAKSEMVGEVIISSPIELNRRGFVECLVYLKKAYPKLTLKLKSDNFPHGVKDNRVDLAISTIEVYDTTIDKIPLAAFPRKLYAAPEYLKQFGMPESLEDLRKHNCLINTTYGEKNHWCFSGNKRMYVTGNFYCDNSEDILIAALGGIGIVNYTQIAADEYVKKGLLIGIELELPLLDSVLYLYHAHQVRSERIRLVRDKIVEFFGQHDQTIKIENEGSHGN